MEYVQSNNLKVSKIKIILSPNNVSYYHYEVNDLPECR